MSATARAAVREALDAAWREFGAELDLSDPLGRQLLANQLVVRGITAGGELSETITGTVEEAEGLDGMLQAHEERLTAQQAQLDALWRELRSLRSETLG